jgi:methyl-accepting chemotaxis protein
MASAVDAAGASEQIARLTGEQNERAQGLLDQAGKNLNAVKSMAMAMQKQQSDLREIEAGVNDMKGSSDQIARGMEEQVRANHEFDCSLNERESQIRKVTESTRYQMEISNKVSEHFGRSEERLRRNAEKTAGIIRGISEMERLTDELRELAEEFRL